MGTFSLGTNSTKKPWAAEKQGPFVLVNEIDFTSGTQFPTKPVQNDIVEALAIPADTLVLRVWLEVSVAETGAADCDVGVTGVQVDGFLDGISLTTTGKKATLGTNGGVLTNPGWQCLVADTIDVKVNSAVTHDEGKFKIKALCVDLS